MKPALTSGRMVRHTIRLPEEVKIELDRLSHFESLRLNQRVTASDLLRQGAEKALKAPREILVL